MRALVLLLLAALATHAWANSPPQASADAYTLRVGESLDIRPPGVLRNDTDTDGDDLFLEPSEHATAGQLVLFPDGSFSYTPDARFRGSDRFTYRACDDHVCSAAVEVRIVSDGIAAPLSARPDRFDLLPGTGATELDVLANDVFVAERIEGGRIDVLSAPSLGAVEVVAPASSPFRFRYRPDPDAVGVDRFRYRLCEASTRCTTADVEVVIAPLAAVRLDVSGAAGFADLPVRALPAMPAPSLLITATGKPSDYAFPLSVDATPNEAWAGGGTGQTLFTVEGGEAGRTVRIRASLDGADADLDLYVGTDADGNRRATSDELTCVSAAVGGSESCTIELDVPADGRRSWWALAHNREGRRVDARLRVLEIDAVDDSLLAWTGPGRLEAGATSAFRLSWTNLVMAPGESAEAWLRVDGEAGVALGWVPLRLVGPGTVIAPRVLRQGDAVRFDLPAGAVADALVLDVPIGTASFEVSAAADGETELALFRAEPPRASDDRVAFRLPSAMAVPVAVATSQAGLATLRIDADAAGRWVVRVRASGSALPEVAVEARLTPRDDTAPLLSPGLYAPAGRPGEGLMVDRTGPDWSGVWFAFDDAGDSTWLYLQGPRPAAGEAWTPMVYRSAVGAAGQRLAIVGRASLAVIDDAGPVFTFEVDGRAGSQRLFDFGRGCPIDRGVPRDLSGLWYDPAIAGEGYGLWITPDYEFYSLFTHDARGQPRYLTAEGRGFSVLGDRRLPLAAYRNACLFCPRGVRSGETVGTFERLFAPALSPILTRVEATLGAGIAGGVSRAEVLERLGGENGGLGCPAP